jgi:beta-glucosidase
VENTGSRTGSTVVQAYIEYPDFGLTTPKLQLKGFAKVKELAPGQAKVVSMTLDKYGLAWWDVISDNWRISRGRYRVWLGSSSENLELQEEFNVEEEINWAGL